MWSRIRYGFRDYAPQLFGLILCADVFLILSLGQDSEPGIAHAPAPGPPPVSAQRGHSVPHEPPWRIRLHLSADLDRQGRRGGHRARESGW